MASITTLIHSRIWIRRQTVLTAVAMQELRPPQRSASASARFQHRGSIATGALQDATPDLSHASAQVTVTSLTRDTVSHRDDGAVGAYRSIEWHWATKLISISRFAQFRAER
ncbi:hypothetical protein [Bradyrhizobium roseum]|uniref:hypothetical protein n=1 Tax=Bradyrhizobium roseum TaxID=3056648 RepID=UPI00262CC32F|nr:hypothetical protein [Bradyrhizobium roseus]WKA26883.1 hypothetical protein QUH67_25345 [Bradyrhizobium roseus]